MKSKYFPIIVLLAAALFFYWVKTNQRGKVKGRTENKTTELPGFNRHPSKIIYSKHALCRMECRYIDESEVKQILEEGTLNSAKTETSEKGTSYALEGITHDRQKVRIVFAPKEDGTTVVVTVIDLDTEYTCDCN